MIHWQCSYIATMVMLCLVIIALISMNFGRSEEESLPESRLKRLFKASENSRWTGGIVPYRFDDNLPRSKRDDYKEKVFSLYEKYSCIRFVPWTTNTKTKYQLDHNNYLIFEDSSKCASPIGNTRRNGQRVACCGWKTCIHEIGHAIGMLHEQTNPMRDYFVRINADKIVSGLYGQFDKESSDVNTFGIYDYASVMHYGVKAWSKDGSQTISFFDADTKPVQDTVQYFYFFEEINDAYHCTDQCTGFACYNGGYKAIVNGKCKCRCPEGLNPTTKCSSLSLPTKGYSCGQIVTLDDETPTVTFQSPTLRKSFTTSCHWYIKSPLNTRILLNFPQFKVRKQDGVCKDTVSVKPYLPGMYGTPYCGNVFKKTVQSAGNILGFSLHQAPTDSTRSIFTAKVSFIREESYCYNLDSNGANYTGTISFTDDSTRCLYWDQVTNCRHHLFNIQDADKRLEANYCRNPDNSQGPWCYTNTEGCVRRFCDACNLGVCKNFDGNCARNIKKQMGYCWKNKQAPSICRKSCGFCKDHNPLPSVMETFCDAPKLPLDAAPNSLENTYSVGETVQVQCNNGYEHQSITCLSNGQWTQLNYVCGTCLPGWVGFGTACYKMYSPNMRKAAADTYCNNQAPNAELVVETGWNHGFLSQLIKNDQEKCTPVWIGLHRNTDNNLFTWKSGEEPTWTNWADETDPRSNNCVIIDSRCAWATKGCKQTAKFVCRYFRPAPVICSNQRNDCPDIKQRNPDVCIARKSFASTYCARTCGFC